MEDAGGIFFIFEPQQRMSQASERTTGQEEASCQNGAVPAPLVPSGLDIFFGPVLLRRQTCYALGQEFSIFN